MVLCQQDKCKHLIAMKDNFEGQEFIIGYQCEEGFTIEINDEIHRFFRYNIFEPIHLF